MDDCKHTCPSCNVVFEAPPPGGPTHCPLCNAPLPLTTASPPAPAAPAAPHSLRWVAAAAVLAFLAGSLVLAMPRLVESDRTPSSAPVRTPPAPEAEPAPPEESPSEPIEHSSPLPFDLSLLQPPRLPGPVPDRAAIPPPTPGEINAAIERGVVYLKKHMEEVRLPCRYEGLLGLALLECGVPTDDPVVQRIAVSLRRQVPQLTGTYEMSLAILFFDRLEGALDGVRIRALAEALGLGQTTDGGWGYHCPHATSLGGLPPRPQVSPPRNGVPRRPVAAWSDHSNTQFAVLGLWVGQRHGRNTRGPLARVDSHFRSIQNSDGGWAYRPQAQASTLANTCSGLLALAAGHGINAQTGREARPLVGPQAEKDRAVVAALECLDKFLPLGRLPGAGPRCDLYTLWSVERVATLYDLKEIGGREWYPIFAHALLGAQQADGSWRTSYPAPVDTCFALLILRRSNLLPDLTATLQGKAPAVPVRPGVPTTILQGGQTFPATGAVQMPLPGPSKGIAQTPQPAPLSGTVQKVEPGRAQLPGAPERASKYPQER